MNPRVMKILEIYTEKFGGELLPKLQKFEAEGFDLVKELEGLKKVREDPKFHGDVSSFMHSLKVVNLLQRLYGVIFLQEKHRKVDVEALETAIAVLPFHLGEYLKKKVGNHTRQELLFFACIFHDIGKLKNFAHLMKEVEANNVKGVTRFIFHGDYGRYYFDDELKAVEERILDFEGKLAKEQEPVKKQFYERAIRYLVELKADFEARKGFFRELELGSAEQKYIAFLIGAHMDMLNFYRIFSDASKEADAKAKQKFMDTLVKNLLKKVVEYDDKYIDCVLLNFCDLLEATHSVKGPTTELYLFLQTCMLVLVYEKELLKGGKIALVNSRPVFEGKAQPKFNVGALFKAFPKDQAITIKKIVESNPDNPGKALAAAGYQKEMGNIMKILKS